MYAMLVLLPPEQSALFNHSDRLLVKTYQPVWDVQCVLLKDSCSGYPDGIECLTLNANKSFQQQRRLQMDLCFVKEKVFSEFYFANFIRRHFSSNFLSVSFIILPGNPLDGKFVPTVDSDNTSFRNVVSIDCWNKFPI